jgi:ATP-dependent Clp endopeptidase proteolytic subunit ClpP
MPGIQVINSASNVPQIVIHGQIGFRTPEDDPASVLTSQEFRNVFVNIEAQHKRCELYVNSPGGNMIEAFAIYDMIKNSPLVVDAVIYGMAASATSWMVMACDSVRITENAMMMIHKPQGGAGGESGNLRSTADWMDKLEGRMVSIIANKTGQDEQYVQDNWLKAGDETWFTAKEALNAGLVDAIVQPIHVADKGPKQKYASADAAWNVYQVFNMAGTNNDKPDNFQMKKDVINMLTRLGVQHSLTETSSDTDVQNAMNTHMQALTDENKKLKDQISAGATDRATNLIKTAEKVGKVKAEEVEDLIKKATVDFAFVSNMLDKIPARTDVNNLLHKGKPEGGKEGEKNDANNRDTWGLREWEQKDPVNLKKMITEDKAKYNKLFEAECGVAADA